MYSRLAKWWLLALLGMAVYCIGSGYGEALDAKERHDRGEWVR